MRIDDYVADLERTLTGPYGPKRDLVVEARDSLEDTAVALEAEGLDRAAAERQAVEEFGELTEIAPGYQSELTAVAGRRLGLLLFISIPITVLMWSALWRLYPPEQHVYATQPGWFQPVSRLLDVAQLATGLYGGLALFALSRGARWIRRPHLVTRSLGVLVWAMLPVTGALSLSLSMGVDDPNTLDVLPTILANLVTCGLWGMQAYCATRCLRITRSRRTAGAARSR
ncbi:hypothetical protein HII36_46050 [Nonomuraea sp. NN258]|uniref:permease prefix domain 1-containing protein n=1 Tax=Nonomuraea antri TaxID=2730852 RepID=UPI0015692371|nr:permease prefix domain 1-containing protein [Nonomuraea antri]NRQ39139.1 hypothetical protein [Nonomuraea antri]